VSKITVTVHSIALRERQIKCTVTVIPTVTVILACMTYLKRQAEGPRAASALPDLAGRSATLSEDNIPVDVLVQKINRMVQTGGIELLRTERSHPDEVIDPDFVPGIAEIV
jgi:hypothetical protein